MSSKLSSMLLGGSATVTAEGYVEGSLFDRLAYFVLIAAGGGVLSRRSINWRLFFQENRWICILFLYFGFSVIWSDYPFISFKRWIKDAGNIVIALVVLTERNPLDAVKALLVRCAFILIPLSALVVKYYPEYGRYYDEWTGQAFDCGVTMDKNCLGMTMFFSGVCLFWMLLELRPVKSRIIGGKWEWYTLLFLCGLTGWLLKKSHSATALSCTLVACAVLFGLRLRVVRSRVHSLGVWMFSIVLLLLVLNLALDLRGVLVGLLGRDLTLTGRTDIWRIVLSEDINPLIGTGFYSFWLGERVGRLSERYFYLLNEAHNGYLEIYLNSGLIGLFLFLIFVALAARNVWRGVLLGSEYATLRLAFLLGSAIYATSEAVFRFGPVWFMVVLFALEYPGEPEAHLGESNGRSPENLSEGELERNPEILVSPVGG